MRMTAVDGNSQPTIFRHFQTFLHMIELLDVEFIQVARILEMQNQGVFRKKCVLGKKGGFKKKVWFLA